MISRPYRSAGSTITMSALGLNLALTLAVLAKLFAMH
jgi:hypothetical protein